MTASIIVAPPHLSFHSSDTEQKFEIFNVHQYPVKFVVKATGPEKYIISNTEGMINTQCKVSIVVTHVDICVSNENIRDKFRIYFSILKNKKFEALGHRDLTAMLYSQKKAPQSPSRVEGGISHGDPPSSSSSPARRSPHHSAASTRSLVAQPPHPPSEPPPPEAVHGHHLLVYLVPMVLGVVALWLPTQDSLPDTPWYLELSVVTKHTVSFFLGVLVTLFYKRVQQADR